MKTQKHHYSTVWFQRGGVMRGGEANTNLVKAKQSQAMQKQSRERERECACVSVCVLLTFNASTRTCCCPSPVTPGLLLPSWSTRTVLQACPEMRNEKNLQVLECIMLTAMHTQHQRQHRIVDLLQKAVLTARNKRLHKMHQISLDP